MTTPGLTSIIVPAWRGGEPPPIAALIDSVAANVSTSWELIVVCNGNDAALIERLRSDRRVTTLATLSRNAGVARGWNIGVHLSLGEHLVFVNEDVVIGKGCIEALVDAMRQDERLAMVGPRGARWHIGSDAARHLDYVTGDGLVDCDVVSGFLFAVPREALVAAGGFDDAYAPLSYEEVDIAQAFKRQGKRLCALGGLEVGHEWGVSAWDVTKRVEWLGGTETIEDINRRNEARLLRKWGTTTGSRAFDGRYYSEDYFARGSYIDTMTRPRVVDGRCEQPLVQTMADVIEASGLLPRGGRVLDVGCSYGFLVAELVERGYDAYGVDFSEAVVAQSPVRNRLSVGNALHLSLDHRYDVVFAGDIYEHLNDAEARELTLRVGKISDRLLAIINKSRHEPSHVNIKSNRAWLTLLGECGFGLEVRATWRGRAKYLQRSAGSECWHLNFLALSRRANTSARKWAARLGIDGAPAWRAIGEVRKLTAGLRRSPR